MLTVTIFSFVIMPVAGIFEIRPVIRSEVREIVTNAKDPFRNILVSRSKLDEEDFKFIADVRDDYDIESLDFVAKRLQSRVNHLRENYGTTIGSPSQFKILLIFIAAVQAVLVPSYQSFLLKNLPFVLVFALVFFLFLWTGLRDQAASQRIEELTQVLELAAARKE